MSRWRSAVRAAIASAFIVAGLPGGTYAQSAPTPAAEPRHTLTGHSVPALARATVLQPTDPNRQLELTVALATRNQDQLKTLIAQQADPTSSTFGRYLTPQQFAAQFAPTQASVDAVNAFAASQGLQVKNVTGNRMLITIEGTVDRIQRAFGVQLRDFLLDGRTVHGPTADPSVPVSISGLVQAVVGLDDVPRLKPHIARPTQARDVHPNDGPGGGYTPAQLRTAYDVAPLPIGAGQTVGVVEFSNYTPADISVFAAQYGLGGINLSNRLVDGGTADHSGAGEAELDIEVVAGLAPGAQQLVYIAPNSDKGELDLYGAMIGDNQAKIITSSWGQCEPERSPAQMNALHSIFAEGVAEGISIFAASGDSGAFDCGFGPLSVDFPGSDPNVVSVGGTSLVASFTTGAYQSESVWNDPLGGSGGGGLSTSFPLPGYEFGPGVVSSYSNGMREVPDVSADADPNAGYSIYCTDPGDNFCDPFFGWNEFGGTSAAAPLWAGVTASINQYLSSQGKPTVGNAHNTYWRLFNTPQRFSPYHDVTVGNNMAYPATPGYDMASGVGTPDAFNIAQDIAGVGATPGAGVVTTLGAPQRLVDTRAVGGPIPAGTSRCFAVAGLNGIPGNAAGVALNVTAVGQTTNGWLTVYPGGPDVPATSTLNFATSEYAMANGAIVRLGAAGQVCVYVGTVGSVPGSAQVLLDATGYLSNTALLQMPMLASPVRLVDTRSSGGPIATGQFRCFNVAGVGGIPADAGAVVLNVTAVDYPARGWLTAYPAGQAIPATSTLNFDTSEYAMANNTIMRIGTGGQVCVSVGTVNSAPGSADVVLDATGYLSSAGLTKITMLTSPQRVVDTRNSGVPVSAGTSRCFQLTGLAGIPANASSVIVNVTAVAYPSLGWLTAYPAAGGLPTTSTLNFDVTEYAMANGAIVKLGSGGIVCVDVGTPNSAAGNSHVILDVVGYLVP